MYSFFQRMFEYSIFCWKLPLFDILLYGRAFCWVFMIKMLNYEKKYNFEVRGSVEACNRQFSPPRYVVLGGHQNVWIQYTSEVYLQTLFVKLGLWHQGHIWNTDWIRLEFVFVRCLLIGFQNKTILLEKQYLNLITLTWHCIHICNI